MECGSRGEDWPLGSGRRRPEKPCVTCRTLTSVFDRLRSISFCRFRTFAQSPSRVALKILCRSRSAIHW